MISANPKGFIESLPSLDSTSLIQLMRSQGKYTHLLEIKTKNPMKIEHIHDPWNLSDGAQEPWNNHENGFDGLLMVLEIFHGVFMVFNFMTF